MTEQWRSSLSFEPTASRANHEITVQNAVLSGEFHENDAQRFVSRYLDRYGWHNEVPKGVNFSLPVGGEENIDTEQNSDDSDAPLMTTYVESDAYVIRVEKETPTDNPLEDTVDTFYSMLVDAQMLTTPPLSSMSLSNLVGTSEHSVSENFTDVPPRLSDYDSFTEVNYEQEQFPAVVARHTSGVSAVLSQNQTVVLAGANSFETLEDTICSIENALEHVE